MTETRLTFKDMCDRFAVTPRTLRYYEYLELLSPQRQGRSRFYTPREVARMTLILRGRRFGFSLEDIRQWLQIYDRRGERQQLETWLRHADRQVVALEQQRRDLDLAIADLQALKAAAEQDLASLSADCGPDAPA